ncbi:phosphatase PAP2 family protein [Streptomyces sp. PsTaAH-124]|uniref:phosphatase PAP2 family protein n=1 Tax=Streptomyces sp. PsTaAH-124 TaxID=1157638 RepID=UPI0003606BA4|nr:phosphatase PAP2 family protein [Streptomyces sp. PsTaAH-124]
MSGRGTAGPVLPSVLRAPLGAVAALGALVLVVLAVAYAGQSGPTAVDARITAGVDGPGAAWRHVALAADALGEPVGAVLLVLAAVAGCGLLRSGRAAVLAVVGPGAAVAVATGLKSVVGRTIHGDGNLSYPSGHTAFATAVGLVVALTVAGRLGLGRAAGVPLVLGAALAAGGVMGWAEVVLGAHYPTDALGGWCTALAVVPVAAWTVDRAAGAGRWRRPR